MNHIVLLIAQSDTIEDGNYLRFGNTLLARGFTVDLCFMESLSMYDSQITARGFNLSVPASDGDPFPDFHIIQLQEADLVWVLTLGMRQSFLDKIQLLYCLQQYCRVINSIDSLMHFKSKYFLASQGATFTYPPTFASNNPDELYDVIKSKSNAIKKSGNGRWIAKPPAGSLGRDIFLLTADDPNTRVILESMTGPEADQYCLLQPYVEEIQQGEKRVLIAGGEPVGQYLRHARKDHRTNVMHGADIEPCELNTEEYEYCQTIGQFLTAHGAAFVGVDLAYPFVIEFNVVNPGGLLTIEALTGQNLAPDIIDNIFPDSLPDSLQSP
ncbi:MAG: hypothetical protein ABGY96_30575 [bacterium]